MPPPGTVIPFVQGLTRLRWRVQRTHLHSIHGLVKGLTGVEPVVASVNERLTEIGAGRPPLAAAGWLLIHERLMALMEGRGSLRLAEQMSGLEPRDLHIRGRCLSTILLGIEEIPRGHSTGVQSIAAYWRTRSPADAGGEAAVTAMQNGLAILHHLMIPVPFTPDYAAQWAGTTTDYLAARGYQEPLTRHTARVTIHLADADESWSPVRDRVRLFEGVLQTHRIKGRLRSTAREYLYDTIRGRGTKDPAAVLTMLDGMETVLRSGGSLAAWELEMARAATYPPFDPEKRAGKIQVALHDLGEILADALTPSRRRLLEAERDILLRLLWRTVEFGHDPWGEFEASKRRINLTLAGEEGGFRVALKGGGRDIGEGSRHWKGGIG